MQRLACIVSASSGKNASWCGLCHHVACVVHVMRLVMCALYHAICMLQAMTGRLLSVAKDVSGARERAASPSKLPVASAKQVTDAQHTWSE